MTQPQPARSTPSARASPQAGDLVIEPPAVCAARPPHGIAREKSYEQEPGVGARDSQLKRPGPEPAAPLDKPQLVSCLTRQGSHLTIARHVPDGIRGDLQARGTPDDGYPAHENDGEKDTEYDRGRNSSGRGVGPGHPPGESRCKH